ncbi:peptidase C13 family protein [Teladorsagia circumcincta]|uniref:Peptidase C13 family protein n=1 Tax=Teladorsagia circumcincta TaxID=45464 RepID=A0A2G9V169_TELCI|nr:peptidase C13 family protein [Teladorsagia circumcincta]
MLIRITFLAALASFGSSMRDDPPNGELYALLVAGSYGWWNYRHQADVAHAYHVLVDHGVKKDNIIVMMYDDIANHVKHISSLYGSSECCRRPGLAASYELPNVSTWHEQFEMHMKMTQNSKNTTSEDRIFVYFTDHGGVGLIDFPTSPLTAKKLNLALKEMHANQKFRQLVFYLEACESGSMFKKILMENINVYAVTAANDAESSYATYCGNELGLPCLGDEFSVNWMEDTDYVDPNDETLDLQFKWVRALTNNSHVMRYGDLSIAKEPVSWFQGTGKAKRRKNGNNKTPQHKRVSWPSRDVELMHLRKMKVLSPHLTAIDDEITRIENDRRNIEAVFTSLVNHLARDARERRQLLEGKSDVENLDCHDDVVRAFDTICIDISKASSARLMTTSKYMFQYDYALKFVYVLNNLCTMFNDSTKIIAAMRTACSKTRSQFH